MKHDFSKIEITYTEARPGGRRKFTIKYHGKYYGSSGFAKFLGVAAATMSNTIQRYHDRESLKYRLETIMYRKEHDIKPGIMIAVKDGVLMTSTILQADGLSCSQARKNMARWTEDEITFEEMYTIRGQDKPEETDILAGMQPRQKVSILDKYDGSCERDYTGVGANFNGSCIHGGSTLNNGQKVFRTVGR